MRATSGWTIALATSLMLVAPSCSRSARQDTTLDPDGEEREGTRSGNAAARSIATARCEREARCGNIGADAKYASRSACVTRVRQDWAEELSAYECPRGVRQTELNECLEDIRDEDCGNPFDSLARALSCGQTEICNDG